jgi:cellobiose dehydrogenase (acceptor)
MVNCTRLRVTTLLVRKHLRPLERTYTDSQLAGALEAAGWQNVSAGLQPAEKNRSYTHPNHMFSNGERGGPMATYLVEAKELPNFTLMVNTTVSRVIRDGSGATGVEVEAFLPGGQCGNINLATGGNVVLAAGAFGSPKILFRSGIGPQDQLEIVKKAEADKMVDEADWINLPVGENLDDHANTEIVITHPNVEFYDFYEAFDNPIPSDSEKYLDARSGILAQSAPNLAVVFWHNQVGPDGISRSNQWTARVESGHGIKSNKSISLSHYLGRGKTSRGRTTITSGLNMVVSDTPYLNNENDLAATKDSIKMVIAALSADKQIDVVFPSKNTTLDAYLEDYAQTTGTRSANHWMGSCKMGVDSGLENGTSVVDTNTKVYGMDNLFIVDASIFPEMITTNPSALIVSVAEHAVEKILALGSSSSGNSTVVPEVSTGSNSTTPAGPTAPLSSTIQLEPTAPAGNNATVAAPSSTSLAQETAAATSAAEPLSTAASATAADSTADASSAAPAASSTGSSTGTAALWERCGGGSDFTGSTKCAEGSTCKQWSEYYFQCVTDNLN